MCVRSMLSRVAFAAIVLFGIGGGAEAASSVCRSLEAQLSAAQRGGRAAAFDNAASRQRQAIASAESQARRGGCFGGGFLKKDQSSSPQCRALVASIGKMKSNLAKLDRGGRTVSARQPSGGNRDAILRQLGANGCGPQYASYVAQPQQRGFLQRLFNPDNNQPTPNVAVVPAAPVTRDRSALSSDGGGYDTGFGGGKYRTLCVRTCDGYYFPISYSTTRSNFVTDEQICRQMCPGTEVALYAHRNPGQDSTRALSIVDQSRYADLATAFAYRTSYNSSCTCGKSTALDIVAGGYSPASIGPFAASLAPVPAGRPDIGEDPETLANRKGQFDPGEIGKPNVARPVAALILPVTGAVRRVGPSYYYAQ